MWLAVTVDTTQSLPPRMVIQRSWLVVSFSWMKFSSYDPPSNNVSKIDWMSNGRLDINDNARHHFSIPVWWWSSSLSSSWLLLTIVIIVESRVVYALVETDAVSWSVGCLGPSEIFGRGPDRQQRSNQWHLYGWGDDETLGACHRGCDSFP